MAELKDFAKVRRDGTHDVQSSRVKTAVKMFEKAVRHPNSYAASGILYKCVCAPDTFEIE